MGILYAQATSLLGALLDEIEAALEIEPDGTVIGKSFFDNVRTKRYVTEEELRLVIDALVELHVLVQLGPNFRLNRTALLENKAYSQGVRDALQLLPQGTKEIAKLCATIPNTLDNLVEKAIRSRTLDLRATLLDLIASAEERVILASPFWDLGTARELVQPLSRRLVAGVRVDLLGRFQEGSNEKRFLENSIGHYEKCELFEWYDRPKGHSKPTTFHFKAAVVDGGSKAYLGTANLTEGGLRSVMELGVILRGEPAEQLLGILNVILSVAISVKTGKPYIKSRL